MAQLLDCLLALLKVTSFNPALVILFLTKLGLQTDRHGSCCSKDVVMVKDLLHNRITEGLLYFVLKSHAP